MNAFLYKIECVTNLHVGSGDANYSVVDNEVEKDPVLGCPIIHSSGVKGALRDFAEEKLGKDSAEVLRLFGSPATSKENSNSGILKFMDACLLCRPLRVKDGPCSYIQTTTPDIINHFIRQANAFGVKPDKLEALNEITGPSFDHKDFFTSINSALRVEDEESGYLKNSVSLCDSLKALLGCDFALAKSLDDYPLPVIARNKLENKISKTLWYEEYVPHDSVFFLIVLAQNKEDLDWLAKDEPCLVQFGGNASVGCGYTKLTRWGGFTK